MIKITPTQHITYRQQHHQIQTSKQQHKPQDDDFAKILQEVMQNDIPVQKIL